MRIINYIVVHCTETVQNAKIKGIQRYWREKLGWKSQGYHYIIKANGDTVELQKESKPSNGVKGYNSQSIHISYIGGINETDTRTEQQRSAMLSLLRTLKEKYPNAKIQGHRDFPNVTKSCPCFNAKDEYKEL